MSDEAFSFWAGVFLGAVLIGGGACSCVQSYYRAEAVEHGVAHWSVDSRGSTKFVWDDLVTLDASAVR